MHTRFSAIANHNFRYKTREGISQTWGWSGSQPRLRCSSWRELTIIKINYVLTSWCKMDAKCLTLTHFICFSNIYIACSLKNIYILHGIYTWFYIYLEVFLSFLFHWSLRHTYLLKVYMAEHYQRPHATALLVSIRLVCYYCFPGDTGLIHRNLWCFLSLNFTIAGPAMFFRE